MSKTITLTEEQYSALQAGEAITIEPPKPKIVPWEPKGGQYCVSINGTTSSGFPDWGIAQFGNEFETKEQTETEAKAMRARNRIAAYVREFAPDWKADWGDSNQGKWGVYFDNLLGRWGSFYNSSYKSACEVYMPEQVARELVEKLNSGEVVL